MNCELEEIGGGNIGAKKVGVPACELKEVTDDAQAGVMEFTGDTSGDEGAGNERAGEGVPEHSGHDELRCGGGVVFLGGGDALDLPEAADFALGALEDFEIDIFDGSSVGEGLGNDVRCGCAVGGQ